MKRQLAAKNFATIPKQAIKNSMCHFNYLLSSGYGRVWYVTLVILVIIYAFMLWKMVFVYLHGTCV